MVELLKPLADATTESSDFGKPTIHDSRAIIRHLNPSNAFQNDVEKVSQFDGYRGKNISRMRICLTAFIITQGVGKICVSFLQLLFDLIFPCLTPVFEFSCPVGN